MNMVVINQIFAIWIVEMTILFDCTIRVKDDAAMS